jgi:hypothetical protein
MKKLIINIQKMNKINNKLTIKINLFKTLVQYNNNQISL